MKFNNEFLTWLKPVLYYPEYHILSQHTQPGPNGGFKLKQRNTAMKKYGLTQYTLRKILWRLEFLALTYEKLAAAGYVNLSEPNVLYL